MSTIIGNPIMLGGGSGISAPIIGKDFNWTGGDGTYQVIDDGDKNWRIKFLSSGIFTPLKNMTIDAFLVGGGGGGQNGGSYQTNRNGGGGGYTKTITSVVLAKDTQYTITVGDGGYGGGTTSGNYAGSDGGSSSAFGSTADGGKSPTSKVGGDGGSGGGGFTYHSSYSSGKGGSDGSNAGDGTIIMGGNMKYYAASIVSYTNADPQSSSTNRTGIWNLTNKGFTFRSNYYGGAFTYFRAGYTYTIVALRMVTL